MSATRPKPILRLCILASSSKGNCAVVEDTQTGACLVIDMGICKRDFLAGLDVCGIDPARIEAVLVTHDHSDHVKGLGVSLRGLAKLGCTPDVYVSDAVARGCRAVAELAGKHLLKPLETGQTLDIAGMRVLPFETSHDALSSCGFRIETASDALGFMTDTGVVTDAARSALQRCRILGIESNHDATMLEDGPYPYPLKTRIAGTWGHLSNLQAAQLLEGLCWPGLEHVVALHLSEVNNLPAAAQEALDEVLRRTGSNADVVCAHPKGAISIG